MSVQVTLRIDAEDYQRFLEAAKAAGLSLPMWLIRSGLAAAAREGK